jgi:hypothetical protein
VNAAATAVFRTSSELIVGEAAGAEPHADKRMATVVNKNTSVICLVFMG